MDQEIPVMLESVTKGFEWLKDHKLSDEILASSEEGRRKVLEKLEHVDKHVVTVSVDAKR